MCDSPEANPRTYLPHTTTPFRFLCGVARWIRQLDDVRRTQPRSVGDSGKIGGQEYMTVWPMLHGTGCCGILPSGTRSFSEAGHLMYN